MRPYRTKSAPFLGLVVFVVGLAHAQHAKELLFSAETDSVTHFVQLPPDALALLTSDKEDFPDGPPVGLKCIDHESSPELPGEPYVQILCRTLPLSSLPGTNYLVIGGRGLEGAHIVPFWVIHKDAHGVKMMFKTRADGFSVLPTRYRGYRELESVFVYQAGADVETNRFRFNGQKYVLFSTNEDHN